MDVKELRKASACIQLAVEPSVASEVRSLLNWAANEIDRLRDELKIANNAITNTGIERLRNECAELRRALNIMAKEHWQGSHGEEFVQEWIDGILQQARKERG